MTNSQNFMSNEQKAELANSLIDVMADVPVADRVEVLSNLIVSELTTACVQFSRRKFDKDRFAVLSIAVLATMAETLDRVRVRISDPVEVEIMFQLYAEEIAKTEGKLQ